MDKILKKLIKTNEEIKELYKEYLKYYGEETAYNECLEDILLNNNYNVTKEEAERTYNNKLKITQDIEYIIDNKFKIIAKVINAYTNKKRITDVELLEITDKETNEKETSTIKIRKGIQVLKDFLTSQIFEQHKTDFEKNYLCGDLEDYDFNDEKDVEEIIQDLAYFFETTKGIDTEVIDTHKLGREIWVTEQVTTTLDNKFYIEFERMYNDDFTVETWEDTDFKFYEIIE